MAVTQIPNVTNWTVTPQNGQAGYFTLMNTWLGQSTSVIASLQTAITAQNTANSEINTLAIQTENNAIIATSLANYQGVWSNATTYSKGQSVSVSGLYYISKVESNLNHIVTDTNYWIPNPINNKIDKVTTPITNALAKIQTDGTIKNSSIIEDANGNIGVGVSILSSWDTRFKVLENIGGSFFGESADINIGNNLYYNGSFKYKNSGYASFYRQSDGQHLFYTAPTGIAGNVITWTNSLIIDSNNDISVPHTYLNTTASAANMFIDSSGKFYRSTSSKKYKTNIENIDKSYVDLFFDNAKPIYYKSLSNNDNPNWGYWGFIAEDIAEFDKRLVHWRYQTKDSKAEKIRVLEDKTIEKYIEIETVNDESKPMISEGVMYERITVLLTAKVQEQQKIINELISRIEALENK